MGKKRSKASKARAVAARSQQQSGAAQASVPTPGSAASGEDIAALDIEMMLDEGEQDESGDPGVDAVAEDTAVVAQDADDTQQPGAHVDDAQAGDHAAEASEPAAPAVRAVRFEPILQDESAFAAAYDAEGSIRGVLIQVAGGRLLLPNATIAEVLSYAEPEAIVDAPEWLLGRMRWRGWQLPMIAFSQMAGMGAERPGLGTKVVVLKALGENARLPYFAMVTQGFPRLVTVTQQTLLHDAGDDEALPVGIQARVRLNQDDALLPDLQAIEALIGDALAQVA